MSVDLQGKKSIQEIPEGLKIVVRNLSQLRLSQHCVSDLITIKEIETKSYSVYAHWMSLVLVANQDVRILFKAHYNTSDVLNLAKAAFGENVNMSKSAIADFMKEYCNLMGGAIKLLLENSKVQVGISLPLVTRGFDEVFSADVSEVNAFSDKWTLGIDDTRIICSIKYEMMDTSFSAVLSNILPEDAKQEDGDLEFL